MIFLHFQERMKDKRGNFSYKPHSQGNPSQVIFRSLSASEIPEGTKHSNSSDAGKRAKNKFVTGEPSVA